MELHLTPETESRIVELATKSGRPAGELVEDAMAGYLEEITKTRLMLDARYDDVKNGRVQAIDGEEFFEALKRREDLLLLNKRSQ
jgi:predicted DNA-binding protein